MEIRKLNMLRGIAALIVLVSHFSNGTGWLNGYLGKGAGQLGVMLFFVLSGFLMSLLYIDKKPNQSSFRKYTLARFARVFPLFLLVVILSFLLTSLGIDKWLYKIPSFELFLSHLFLLKGTSVLWTIGAEVQFYILFMGVWYLYSENSLAPILLLVSSIIILFFMDFPRPRGGVLGVPYDFALIRSLPYFLVGVLFGQIYNKCNNILPKNNWAVLSFIIILALYPKIFYVLTGFKHGMWADIGVFISVTAVFFAIVFFVKDSFGLMSNRLGDFLGGISYSLYLLHLPVYWQVRKLEIESLELQFLIFIICSLLVAHLSFKYFETPASKYIRKKLM